MFLKSLSNVKIHVEEKNMSEADFYGRILKYYAPNAQINESSVASEGAQLLKSSFTYK